MRVADREKSPVVVTTAARGGVGLIVPATLTANTFVEVAVRVDGVAETLALKPLVDDDVAVVEHDQIAPVGS